MIFRRLGEWVRGKPGYVRDWRLPSREKNTRKASMGMVTS
jgi:hypothetical protein